MDLQLVQFHHTVELLLLANPAVAQARVIKSTLDDARWIVTVAVDDAEEMEQPEVVALVGSLRDKLKVAMGTTYATTPLPTTWFHLDDFPVNEDDAIDDEQLQLVIAGDDAAHSTNVICLDFETTPVTVTKIINDSEEPESFISSEPEIPKNTLKRTVQLPHLANSSIASATILQGAWAVAISHFYDTNDVCFGLFSSIYETHDDPITSPVLMQVQINEQLPIASFLSRVQKNASQRTAPEDIDSQMPSIPRIEMDDEPEFSSALIMQLSHDDSATGDEEANSHLAKANAIMKDTAAYGCPLVLQALMFSDRVELVLNFIIEKVSDADATALMDRYNSAAVQLIEQKDNLLASVLFGTESDSVVGQSSISECTDNDSIAQDIGGGCNLEELDMRLGLASPITPITPMASFSLGAVVDGDDANDDTHEEDSERVSSCIHELIDAQAHGRPNAIAVDAWDGKFTYQQLNSASNRLASHLIHHYAVQVGDLVHVCFEKSIWFFVSILAISKAGAVWVPLEPSHPLHYQEQIVKQTAARLVLTSSANVEKCAALVSQVLAVNAFLNRRLTQRFGPAPSPPTVAITPDQAAYVMFTSRGAGVPKGVVMEHGSVCTSQKAVASRLGLTPSVRMLQNAPYTFDICVGEILGPLITGATVCVPSEEASKKDLKACINDTKATWAFLAPSAAKSFSPDDVPGLELVLMSGETVERDVFESWVVTVRLFTGWGLAETGVFCTLHEWQTVNDSHQTIGRPVGGSCWIVNPEDPHQLTPLGSIGELVIQGPILMRDYLGDAHATKAALMTNLPSWAPERTSPGWNTLFKSGELATYTKNGMLEFIRYKGDQADIQGQRIDLRDIEFHLQTALQNARQIAATTLEGEAGTAIVAYFSMKDETKGAPSDGIDHEEILLPLTIEIQGQVTTAVDILKTVLPSYMRPTIFFPCKFMPSATSSTLDRDALKKLTKSLPADVLTQYTPSENANSAPASSVEDRIQSIWALIFGVPPKSINKDDSFFSLGGDSIAAIEFVARAHKMGLTIHVSSIFADPRLSAVAAATEEKEPETNRTEAFGLLPKRSKQQILTSIRDQCKLPNLRDIEDAYPCTSLQEGLMALALKHPGSYIARNIYQIPEHVQTDRLRRAWEQTVNICYNLRTRTASVDGTSYQAIISEGAAWEPTDNLDLRSVINNMKEMKVEYGSKLCRYALVTEPTGERYFVLALHQTVFDDWSLGIVLETLQNMYQDKPTPPLEPHASFMNYISQLETTPTEEYWISELSGAKPSRFPKLDSAGNMESASKIMITTIKFPQSTETSITKATILRAAWAIILARYGDVNDVCFGATVSGRHAPVVGINRVVGPALATVPVRVRLNGEESVSSFLESIQKQTIEMVAHEQFGLQNIARLNPNAKNACQLSSLLMVKHIQPVKESVDSLLLPADLTIADVQESIKESYTYPLMIQANTHKDHVDLVFAYSPAVLPEPQLQALASHLEHVVSQLMSAGDMMIGKISLTSKWDVQKITKWNEDQVTEVRSSCIHDMISDQASMDPDQEALTSRAGRLTYQELDEKSTNLAKHLAGLGLKSEMIVPTCFEKSIWAIVAQLAIMKAGGVFMPLDPKHPIHHRRLLIEAVNAPLVLVSPLTAEGFTEEDKIVLVSPSMSSNMVSMGRSRFGVKSVPSSAAYLIITSGSASAPEGVMVEQAAMCSSIMSRGTTYGFGPHSRVLQYSDYGFDASIAESFTALAFGGTVCVPSDQDRLADIGEFINDMEINFTLLSPVFAKTLNPASVPTLRKLVLTGDALTTENIEKWFGRVEVISAYGPTEVGGWCCTQVLRSRTESPKTIGHSLNSRCWIVSSNDHTQLVPVGCVGELVIQGPTLARGYFNDADKTQKYFIDDVELVPALSNGSRARFYKTGDLVKSDFNGTIEYVGRMENRPIAKLIIEPAPEPITKSIAKPIAEPINKPTSEPIIEAISPVITKPTTELITERITEATTEITAKAATEVTTEAIAETPTEATPETPIEVIEATTVAATEITTETTTETTIEATTEVTTEVVAEDQGWNLGIADVDDDDDGMENPMEGLLKSMWADMLNVPAENIKKRDSFMDHGGDSVTAIQMVTRLRDMGLNIDVQAIFANPRLSIVAGMVEGTIKEEDVHAAEPLSMLPQEDVDTVLTTIGEQCNLEVEDLIEDSYPCTGLQEGLMALAVKKPGFYTAKHVYRLSDDIDTDRFKAAWSKTLEVCTNLRTRIILYKHMSIQAVIDDEVYWEPIVDTDLCSLIQNENYAMDIGYGSRLCRYAFLTESQERRFFILCLHQSIADSWSMTFMLDVLQKAYMEDNMPELQPYATFINYSGQIDREAAVSYWSGQLAGAQRATFPPPNSSDGDFPNGRVLKTQVPIQNLADSPTMIATVLRLTWAVVLARYNNTDDICFGTTVTGRQAPVTGIDSIVGSTLATVPVRVRLHKKQTVKDLLEALQIQESEMMAYEQFGMRSICNISREIKDACDFSSLFVIRPKQQVTEADCETPVLTKVDLEESGIWKNDVYYHYPLVVACTIEDENVALEFNYHDTALGSEKLKALSHHFRNVFQQLCAQPDADLGSISAAGSWDVEKVAGWNKGEVEIIDSCVHHLIEKRAKMQPGSPAISAWDGKLSYGQLDDAANKLANYLLDTHRVQAGEFIPVCIEKSAWYSVAILAINKAGAAWVPIDPAHPSSQLQQMVKQTKAKMVVTSDVSAYDCIGLAPRIIKLPSDLDDYLVGQTADVGNSPQIKVTPADPAYVIFTEDISGALKGSVIQHHAVSTSQRAISRKLCMTPNVRLLQFSAHEFDLSVSEIIGPLISGACVCVPSEHDRMWSLKNFMEGMNVNWAYLTPTFAQTLSPEDLPSLELLLLAGEAVTEDILETWDGKLRLIAGWGSAETSTLTSLHEWHWTNSLKMVGIPAGGLFWIVDPENSYELAPVGCVGEIVLQGPTIQKEYLFDAPQTESSMLTSFPAWATRFGSEACNRFYKTGDLGFYNPDGMIEYVGRKDRLIKMRGAQINLCTIESSISEVLESIGGDVVVDIIQTKSSEYLVAFLMFGTGEDSQKRSATEFDLSNSLIPLDQNIQELLASLVRDLSGALPQYMIPDVFLPLQDRPYTSSVMINRAKLRCQAQALPEEKLDAYKADPQAAFIVPSTELQRNLATMWADVLEMPVDKIGIHDNFYYLGGDSMRFAVLTNALYNEYSVLLSTGYENDQKLSIDGLAELIENEARLEDPVKMDLMEELANFIDDARYEKQRKSLQEHHLTELPPNATVFLTDATGYLGTEILRRLLCLDAIGTVVVLVSATSSQHGMELIRKAARIAKWWDSTDTYKIEIWTGDLSQSHLGLNDSQWKRLCGNCKDGNIDAVVHNGDTVNWIANYEKLRAANVTSTVDLLGALAESPVHPKLVYVSDRTQADPSADVSMTASKIQCSDGYTQTKFISESIIRELSSELPPQNRLSIVKPGFMIGAAEKSMANTDDIVWRMVATAAEIRAFPQEPTGHWLEIADVNNVAAAITGQLVTIVPIKPVVNPTLRMSIAAFWQAVNSKLETPCYPMPWDEWITAALSHMEEVGENHPLWAVQYSLSHLGSPLLATDDIPVPLKTVPLQVLVQRNVEYLLSAGVIPSLTNQALAKEENLHPPDSPTIS